MNSLEVEELISKYWNCETSLEEEALLRNFFLHEEVPTNLVEYKALFNYQNLQPEIHVSAGFEQRILASISENQLVVLSPKKHLFQKVMRIAAVVLLMLAVSGVTAYLLNDKDEYQFNYTDTFSSPQEAYSVIYSTVYAVSTNLNEGQKESMEALSKLDVFFEYIKPIDNLSVSK